MLPNGDEPLANGVLKGGLLGVEHYCTEPIFGSLSKCTVLNACYRKCGKSTQVCATTVVVVVQAGLSKNALGLAKEQMCPRALPGGAVGHELVVYGL